MHVVQSVSKHTQRRSICELGTQMKFNPKTTVLHARKLCICTYSTFIYCTFTVSSRCAASKKKQNFQLHQIDFPPRNLPSTLPPTFVHTPHIHHIHICTHNTRNTHTNTQQINIYQVYIYAYTGTRPYLIQRRKHTNSQAI